MSAEKTSKVSYSGEEIYQLIPHRPHCAHLLDHGINLRETS